MMNLIKRIFKLIFAYYASIPIWVIISLSWYVLLGDNRLWKLATLYIYSSPAVRSMFFLKRNYENIIKNFILDFKSKRALNFCSNYTKRRIYITKKIVYIKNKLNNQLCIVPTCFRKGVHKQIENSLICQYHRRRSINLPWWIVFVWRPAKFRRDFSRKDYD